MRLGGGASAAISEGVCLSEEQGMDEKMMEEMRASSEPCNPTTSDCARPAHFVRRRKGEIRDAVVPVRFTRAERDNLKGFAEARRLSLSDFIRRVALGKRLPSLPPSPLNLAMYQELARLGNNLNQLVRAVHGGQVLNVDGRFLQELASQVHLVARCLLQVAR